MADSDFTPKTGIFVNMNVVPASQMQSTGSSTGGVNALLLSITSGKAPDVALGVSSDIPVEFAIRDAVYDLSQFNGFEEVKERFLEDIFIPFEYRGGVYAIPDTMDFYVMFYRKDIVQELNLLIPDTREDLYNHVLPALYQHGLEFYYPAEFSQFIYQQGASYYTPDGMRSALIRRKRTWGLRNAVSCIPYMESQLLLISITVSAPAKCRWDSEVIIHICNFL